MFKSIMFSMLICMAISVLSTETANAQNAYKVSCKKKNDITCLAGQEVVFISGMVKDTDTRSVLSGKDLNFENSGVGVLYAKISETGHYAIAIQKDVLEGVRNLAVQIEGYETIILKDLIASEKNYINRDILLRTLATIKPVTATNERAGLNQSTANPFIMQF